MEIDEVSGGASELEEEFAIFPWIFSRKSSLSLSLSLSVALYIRPVCARISYTAFDFSALSLSRAQIISSGLPCSVHVWILQVEQTRKWELIHWKAC